jgi:flagellar P-ring protein precursor FlgI
MVPLLAASLAAQTTSSTTGTGTTGTGMTVQPVVVLPMAMPQQQTPAPATPPTPGSFMTASALPAAQPLPANSYVAPVLPSRKARIGDIATIEGVRDNPLIGYGLVVGLKGTGDSQQTLFTTQMLGNLLQKMGTQVASTMKVNNVAAVLVTASLPPFASPGTTIDVSVSSIGDAKSIEGGTLLLAPLRTATGEVYATAQGPVSLGGYSAGGGGTAKIMNHPTAGRIPNGGIVERDNSIVLSSLKRISLLLRDPDFATAQMVADAINHDLQRGFATAIDSRRIELDTGDARDERRPEPRLLQIPALLGRIQALTVAVNLPAKVVVNERTGTIVMGRDVRLSAVSILHGSLTIEISTQYQVSQPNPLSQSGTTEVVPVQTVQTKESPARRIELNEGATVEQLVNGLQTIGATARDVISILQAIKAAGAMQAELEVL